MTVVDYDAIERTLTEKLKRWRYRSLFPSEGPLRRELYPRHMAFFRAGLVHRERLFMAGNRVGKCCTAQTKVDTPNGPTRMIDLRDGDEVFAWSNECKIAKKIQAPFRKAGLHECALIIMSDGRWVEAADHHRLLTSAGEWRLLSELLPQSFFSRRSTSSECAPSIRGEDGQRWSQKLAGWTARCFEGRRLCGEPLRRAAAGVGSFALRQACALPHSPASSRSGAQASSTSHSLSQTACRPSMSALLRQRAARCAGWLARVACTPSAPSPLKRLAAPLLRVAAGFVLRSLGGAAGQALPFVSLKIEPSEFLEVDGQHVMAVIPVGRHEVYDFTVPDVHNYCAAGLVHHNTISGAYETMLHATGRYPDWWEGRVFDWAGGWTAAGTTLETTRDIVQAELLGPGEDYGTGMIPACDIDDIKKRPNTNGAVDYAMVKRQGGGFTRLAFKSFDQGRKAFEGTAKQGVWLDEEPPRPIYTECLTRTATTDGIIEITFTPLNGATDVVMDFIENAELVS